MACFSISNIKLSGIAAAVPKASVSNWDYELLTDAEKKMLVKTIGVEKKRVAPENMATSDLCEAAAESVINELGWNKDEIGIVVFLSQSRDYFLPATAIILQDKLKLSRNCLAFDISLGCSGFPYGLSVIAGLMSSAHIKKGLLMMGDISSATCAYEDKSTYPLFGDAGTVTAIEFDADAPPIHFDLKSNGAGYESIIIRDGGIRNKITEKSLVKTQISPGIERAPLNVELNGVDVFNFSITEVPPLINEFYEFTGTSNKDYDYFLMHQANLLMNETIRKKLKFEPEKVPYSIREYGNTSSASIPLTIVTELKEEVISKKVRLLCSGFGVGLSWGAVAIEADKIVCPDLIEL